MLEEELRAFAFAGLRLGGRMLDALGADAAAQVGIAMNGGARLVIELTPLPAFERADLTLVEREGRRHTLASVELRKGQQL